MGARPLLAQCTIFWVTDAGRYTRRVRRGEIVVSDADQFTNAEANPLTAALVCRTASRLGIRVLVIKGLSLQEHGLRTDRIPADVDVLVEPGRLDELVSAVLAQGWEYRPVSFGDRLMTHHSITLLHHAWPNDVDAHRMFPGLLAGEEASFRVLWDHRVPVRFAGVECCIADRPSTMTIWALHSLRGSARESRHARELRQLIDLLPTLSDAEQEEFRHRIVELGADEPLRDSPDLAAFIGDRHGVEAEGELDAWRSKVAQQTGLSPWVQVLREAPVLERSWILARAVWPTRRDLLLLYPATVDTTWGRFKGRAQRIGRVAARLARQKS